MIDLQVYFDGLFQDPKITHPRLVVFAVDNVHNMDNNNPGHIYDDAITATTAAAANLESFTTQKIADLGSRKGGTTAKKLRRRDVEVYIGNRIGWVRALLGGKNDPRFVDTFPQAMKAFYHTADIVFEENLTSLIKKAHFYITELGADFETDLIALKAAYVNAETAQGVKKTAVRSDIVTEQMAADVLSDQLTDNVLLIARHNRRSTTAAGLYFNVALLYPPKTKEIKKGKPAANSEVEICNIVYAAGKYLHIINLGATILVFGMKLNGQKVGNTVTLAPNQKSAEAMSYYFSNGTSLYVINHGNSEGMFRMEIVM
jgi:hypothetical protein